jgi:hypothetical protein
MSRAPNDELRNLTDFQRDILTKFNTGRRFVSQYTRGGGYTTAIMYACVEDVLNTNESVVFVSDVRQYYANPQLAQVAYDYFGVNTIRVADIGVYIKGKLIRTAHPGQIHRLRGTRYNIYGDISTDNFCSFPDFAYLVNDSRRNIKMIVR